MNNGTTQTNRVLDAISAPRRRASDYPIVSIRAVVCVALALILFGLAIASAF